MKDNSILLEFDNDLGYGSETLDGKKFDEMDWLKFPVILWAHQKIGAIKAPKCPEEVLHGDGWRIFADWSLTDLAMMDPKPRTYLEIHKPIDQQLVTEFWMRFQR